MDVKLKITDLSALFDLKVVCGVKESFGDGETGGNYNKDFI